MYNVRNDYKVLLINKLSAKTLYTPILCGWKELKLEDILFF